jgi:membrane glycosyltransferase
VLRHYRPHTLVGITLAIIAYLVSPALLLWMLPVVIGLAFAVPLVRFTAAAGPGRAFRRLGLLRIPEEQAPPRVLARARSLHATLEAEECAAPAGLAKLFADPALLAAHRDMLPPPRTPGRDAIDVTLLVGLAKLDEAASLGDALAALDDRETAAVLAHPHGVDRLAVLYADHATK